MTKINHDLRSNDGATIYHKQEMDGASGQGNLAMPNIYDEDSAQQYPIGTRLVVGERTFHYFCAGTAMTNLLLGVVSYDCRTGETVESYDTSQAAGVGTTASPLKIDGSSTGTPALNYYAGHTIVIYVSLALGRRQMQVISSSASALDSGTQTVELVLDQPTPMAIGADTGCDLFPSKYADVRSCFAEDSGYLPGDLYPFVGVPMSTMTSGQWGWVQTYGPCFITNTSTGLGNASYDRTATFNNDGSVEPLSETITSTTGNQIAGWTLAGNTSGSEWIQLILDR